MKKLLRYLGIILLTSVILVACNEDDDFSSDPSLRLAFSCDTLSFDTLFTTIGSPTGIMKVYNRNSSALRIQNVSLKNADKGFRVNVDGQYSNSIEGLEIRKGDSLYVFVEVTPRENGADTPLFLSDSICFTLESGVQQYVTLLAYGRDVQFLRGKVIERDTLLTKGHYVVYDSLYVKDGATLSLSEGCTLYFHAKTELKVHGTLHANGTLEEPVVFRGDRTDNMFDYLPYDRIPGQWGGITFASTSNGNVLRHCDIHSANYGLFVQQGDTTKQRLTIESSRVENVNGNALETVCSRIDVSNSLIANAGGNCVKIVGGSVRFLHCTIANFFVFKLRDVALALHNSIDGAPAPLYEAIFANCIIAGSKEDEVMGYLSNLGDTVENCINYRFVSSLVNTVDDDNENFIDVVYDNNEETPFAKEHFRLIDNKEFNYDFHLTDSTTARGIASSEYSASIRYDLDGVERPMDKADAGCFQYVELPAEDEIVE